MVLDERIYYNVDGARVVGQAGWRTGGRMGWRAVGRSDGRVRGRGEDGWAVSYMASKPVRNAWSKPSFTAHMPLKQKWPAT